MPFHFGRQMLTAKELIDAKLRGEDPYELFEAPGPSAQRPDAWRSASVTFEKMGGVLAMPRTEFEKLKKGDKVTITYDSPIRKGTTSTFTVTGRSKSEKYGVDKVSMAVDGKGKYFLYSRSGGDATLAHGDMSVSMTKIVIPR